MSLTQHRCLDLTSHLGRTIRISVAIDNDESGTRVMLRHFYYVSNLTCLSLSDGSRIHDPNRTGEPLLAPIEVDGKIRIKFGKLKGTGDLMLQSIMAIDAKGNSDPNQREVAGVQTHVITKSTYMHFVFSRYANSTAEYF